MIKHEVFLKFKKGLSDRQLDDLGWAIKMMASYIPEVKSLHFTHNAAPSYKLGLIVSYFDDEKAYEAYNHHPAYTRMVEVLQRSIDDISVLDTQTLT